MPQLLATAGKTPSGKALTPAMIGQAVETFPSVGKAPLSLSTHVKGHQVYLKAGEISGLSANEDNTELYGDIAFVPALQGENGAVAQGLFDERSIGLLPGEDGFYLSHVALLGGVPPAIKGLPALKALEDLEEVVFSELMDPSAGALWFSSEGEPLTHEFVFSAMSDTFLTRILDAEIARVMASEDITRDEVTQRMATEAGHESTVSVMHVLNGEMTPRDEWLEGYARALGISKTTLIEARYMYAESTETPPQPTNSPMPEPTKPPAKPATSAAPEPESKPESKPEGKPEGKPEAVQFSETPEYKAWLDERRESDAEALRRAASGKMPTALIDELLAFSERLPEERLDFSEKRDGTDMKSLRRVLTTLVGKLPDMVPQGSLVFSDGDDPNKETQEVLAKAVTKF